MADIYKYHENDGEWVIRRYHDNGYEGIAVANGEIEAGAICEAMNHLQPPLEEREQGPDTP